MKPLPVYGYTDQSDYKVDFVNDNKTLEEIVLRRVDQHAAISTLDQRMVSIARTKIQETFMWLNRSVFQPERLKDFDAGQLENLLENIGLTEAGGE